MPLHKIRHIAYKELKHILRDPRSLSIAILMPIMMTLLYGYAINLDIKNIKLAIIDFDNTRESRELAGKFYHSKYFRAPSIPPSLADPERSLKAGHTDVVLTIQPGFASALSSLDHYELGLLIDGADANLAAAAVSYSNIILWRFLQENIPGAAGIPGVVISQQVLYNPDLKSSHFFVPGLIAIILMMISALLTSITIAREKETGTIEQLLTTPITPVQVIIGKVIPYVVLAFIDGALIIAFGVWHFGVPFEGSSVLLILFGVIYIIAALSIGILISTLVRTQQVAMMAAILVTVLPSVMMSGFIFEITNMPSVLQVIAYIIPAKYFLLIVRGILLKGSGLSVLWIQAAFLVLLTVILLGVSAKKFKLKMD
jgi:ABC-2 type transport system permease protein